MQNLEINVKIWNQEINVQKVRKWNEIKLDLPKKGKASWFDGRERNSKEERDEVGENKMPPISSY